MVWLDCTSAGSALTSISQALGIAPGSLVAALRDYDDGRFDDWSEDAFVRMPRELLGGLGTGVSQAQGAFAGAFYFHGTRSARPDAFSELGILPLGEALDVIWSQLRVLAGADITDVAWDSFRGSLGLDAGGHSGALYRLKTADESMWGPHAVLVREALLHPGVVGIHDFLRGPEIVEDIAEAFETEFGIPLGARYRDATRPCIVKFRFDSLGAVEARSALWYLYSRVRNQRLVNVEQGGFSGDGKAVPPNQVVAVEPVPGDW